MAILHTCVISRIVLGVNAKYVTFYVNKANFFCYNVTGKLSHSILRTVYRVR